MKSFIEFSEIEYNDQTITAESDEYDAPSQDLNELSLRNTSALVLIQRIHARSKRVHQSDDVNEQLREIASQNTHLAAMVFALNVELKKKR